MKKDGFRYVTALGLILILLYPSIVKFDHHHDHESLPAKGNNLQNSHSSCSLCEFQFSIFDKNLENEYSFLQSVVLLVEIPLYSSFFPKYDNYNFSLRAPPSIFKHS